MTLSRLRKLYVSPPGAAEQIQWGKDLVSKVGGKMSGVRSMDIEPGHDAIVSFKGNDETFVALVSAKLPKNVEAPDAPPARRKRV